ncbi:MAG: hypothetical protein QME52_01745 [Bacteroidota bacterium]|nr:hypothetical protein [Bacteroidota bacterium]
MGLHLRPGHKIEEGKKGWVPTGYEDFLTDIKVGAIDLGYWGEKVDKSISSPDGHSPIYSIPNPWAAAYLFNFVLSDNSHPLAEPLIVQLLNLLSDYTLYGSAELRELNRPSEGDPFYKLWAMAPDFIRYGDSIYFFSNTATGEILGGLSKTSLAWTSQQYVAKEEKNNLLANEALTSFLHQAHQAKKPDFTEDAFNTFWQHASLVQILKTVPPSIEFQAQPASPESWLKRLPPMDRKSEFYDDLSRSFVFDEDSLTRDRQIFLNQANPPGFIDEIKRKKSDVELPMNSGAYRWVILDSLLEPCWINQNKVESSLSEGIHSMEKGFLYPFKPGYLQQFHLKLKDLKILGKMNIGNQNARADIQWNEKRKVSLNTQFVGDTRSLAIWPPFQSNFVDNYVVEYDVVGIEKLEKLEFFDESGSQITCSGPAHHIGQNFRIYKLSKMFPRYIRVLGKYKGNLFGGFLEFYERRPTNKQGNITIGFDFGTSHTSIAYSKDGTRSIMNFQKAKPILVADQQSLVGMLYNFLPPGLTDAKPTRKEDWEKRIPWQPFQTQWMDVSNGQINLDALKFIEDGTIPFLHYAEETRLNPIIENLKWGAPANISIYRTLFLKQLLMMAVAEAEAIGFENLKIRWSFPKAFSPTQYQNLKSFWTSILSDLRLTQQ